MSDYYRTRKEKLRLLKKGIIGIVAVLLLLVVLGILDRTSSQTEKYAGTPQKEIPEGLIEVDGTSYVPKKNLETWLFMGIDDPDVVVPKEEYDGTGQCDVLMLMIRDISTGTYQLVKIDRNTMTDVKNIDTKGKYLATTNIQLSLAHAYGNGMENSCENTCDAVSNLFGGQKITGYAAVNMGAIKTLNQMVGGVTVTIEDDFGDVAPNLKLGETVKLTDDEAYSYISGRMGVGSGTNVERMSRQDTYLSALEPLLREKVSEDPAFPIDIYDNIQPYMVTNITAQKFSKLCVLVLKEQEKESYTLEGTNTEGDFGYVEFTPDEKSLQELILKLFYKEY